MNKQGGVSFRSGALKNTLAGRYEKQFRSDMRRSSPNTTSGKPPGGSDSGARGTGRPSDSVAVSRVAGQRFGLSDRTHNSRNSSRAGNRAGNRGGRTPNIKNSGANTRLASAEPARAGGRGRDGGRGGGRRGRGGRSRSWKGDGYYGGHHHHRHHGHRRYGRYGYCYGYPYYGYYFGVGYGCNWGFGYYGSYYPGYWYHHYRYHPYRFLYWWCPGYYYYGVPTFVYSYDSAYNYPPDSSASYREEPASSEEKSTTPLERKAPSIESVVAEHIKLGDFYFREGKYDKAAESYLRALAYAPDDASLHFILADALFAMGDYHYAAFIIRKALRLDPEMAKAKVDKREFYKDRKEFTKQMNTLRRYIGEKPFDTAAYLVLGYNLYFSAQDPLAKKAFEKVLELAPEEKAAKLFLDALETRKKEGATKDKVPENPAAKPARSAEKPASKPTKKSP